MRASKIKRIFLDYVLLFVGLMIMSFGIAMFLRSGLGANPLTTFTHGVSLVTGFSVGRSSQSVMLVAVLFVFLLDRKRIGTGTLINGIFTGIFIDIFMKIGISPGTFTEKTMILMIATLTFAIGLGMYVSAGKGEGAVDAFMIIMRDRFHLDIKKARIALDIILIILGLLFGSHIGIGTVISALLTGPIMGMTMIVMKYEH